MRHWLLAGISLCASNAALAETCGSASPPPPPAQPAVTDSKSNITIGTANPYAINTNGLTGCDGQGGSNGGDGQPAQQGGAAGAINLTLDTITVTGASLITGSGLAFGTLASAVGGNGGNGGTGDQGAATTQGGKGGDGGAGAPVTLTFTGQIDMRTVPKSPGIGIAALAIGGSGGSGAGTLTGGIASTYGGNGGQGAAGAAASATVSGPIIADAAGVYVDASGGGGGKGGDISGGGDVLREIYSGKGGAGAGGGSANVNYAAGTLTGRTAGIVAAANGGRGGDGGSTSAPKGFLTAGAVTDDGGNGGNGGQATATLASGATINLSVSGLTPAALFPYGGAVAAISVGGDGGNGQDATGGSLNASSGSGGNGGNGGAASATVLGTINHQGFINDGVQGAIDVYSGGGRGGAGGNSSALSGTAGGGGIAGNAGAASLVFGSNTVAASVNALLADSNAILVQSIGGGGGSGGSGRGLNVNGGSGSAGGSASTVTAQIINGTVIADGTGATGLLAQSIGGGGGSGGDATNVAIGANLAVGGNGGQGGSGGDVNVTLGTAAVIGVIDAFGDQGVLAQSIGGAGGKAGSAYSTGSGFLSMTVGGDGGTGATAGKVTIANDGLVTTYGSWGTALHAQSVGGGGGDGGSAFSNIFGVVPTAAVAIGGRGGDGGTGGDATVTNTANGQVTTYGSNANALVAQSVGGGGGTGGTAVARAVDFTLDPRIPAVSIAIGLGGSGGTGNTGGAASVNNAGFVATSGEQAYAVFAQSVGGGGGIGGDATAVSYSGGFTDNAMIPPIAVSVALGASGGVGGAGGAVSTTNSGLILTLGTDSIALVAQSVGGGSGAGGAGDSLAVANDPEDENPDDPTSPKPGKTLGVAIGVGGKGGTGGNGGTVTLNNSGGIVTSGDGAEGYYAQSVGGGGGTAGGGVANAGGNTLTVAVSLGGSGGAGGDGGNVTATNTGAILTRGADASGLYVQSVGGGGGEAGKGASTSGGVDNVAKSTVLYDTIAAGLNVGAEVNQVVDGVFKFGAYAEETKGIQEIANILTQPKQTLKSLVNKNLDLSLSLGGQGGAAGKGGDVTLSNAGAIWTFGAQSDAIFAQSVGGGGGRGGSASSTGSSYDDTRNQVSLGVSGGGGTAGNGGAVSVTNAAGGDILTRGVLGFGIYAQSVGGGGGAGAQSQDVNGSLQSLAIGFNGRDGSQGTGGVVAVNNAGSIRTQGKNGIAIIAQSVGGGGGLVKSMTTDMTFDPDMLQDNPQGRLLDIHSFNLSFGGGTNSQGDGGAVNVTNSGTITTDLRNAHGIVAQSVGGGGGITVGGQLLGRRVDGLTPGPNTGSGNGGAVTVALNPGTVITTAGDGAYGVFAQSVGGGGGFAGDMSNISTTSPTLTNLVIFAGNGTGGATTVNLQNAAIATSGNYAAGILAQSVGGGGGVLAQDNQLQIGSGGGTGAGGVVTIGLVGSSITTAGVAAPAILAYSNGPGTADGVIQISLDSASRISRTAPSAGSAGALDAAIAVLGPTSSAITNNGTITATLASGAPGTAITTAGPAGITNRGSIQGAIGVGGVLSLTNSGSIQGGIGIGGDLLLNTAAGSTITGTVNTGGSFKFTNAGSIIGTINATNVFNGDNNGVINGTISSVGGGLSSVNNGAGGTINGAVSSGDDLIFSNGGVASAAVRAMNKLRAGNSGTFTGSLYAENTTTIGNNGSMTADITAPNLTITNNGTLAGTITSFVTLAITGTGLVTSGIFSTPGCCLTASIDAPWAPTGANNLYGGTLAIGTLLRLGSAAASPNITFRGGAYTMGANSVIEIVVAPDGGFANLALSPEATFAFAPVVKVKNAVSLHPGLSVPVFSGANLDGSNFVNAPPPPQSDSAVVTVSWDTSGPNGNAPRYYSFNVAADYAAGATGLSQTQANVAAHLNARYVANDPGLRAALVRLAATASQQQAVANLSAISGQSLLATSAIRLEQSLAQARGLFSCPSFDNGTILKETSCIWLRGEGNWANRTAENGYAGYRWNQGGLTMGGQQQVSDHWFVGGSIGYQDGRLNQRDGLVRITSEGVTAAVSAKYQDGPLALGVATGLGRSSQRSQRDILLAAATATARSSLFSWGVHGRAAWRFGGDHFYAEPELHVSATYLDAGHYRESGAGVFDLDVRDGSDWVFNIMPGAKVGTRIDFAKGRGLDLYVGGGVDFILGNSLRADARFVAASGPDTFTTQLASDRTAARLTGGLRLIFGPKLELKLQYDGRLSARETWHGGQAKLIWKF